MVEGGVENKELSIRGFDFNLFDEDREGFVGDDMKEIPYLFMIIRLWNGDW